jgi:ABC-2 type transport system permease protein
MFKLRATILKDFQILIRDQVGLTLMFVMPILLAIVITSIQNGTFKLVNENKVPLIICSRDSGEASTLLVQAISKVGMFELFRVPGQESDQQIKNRMHEKDALFAVIIPEGFSLKIAAKAENIAGKALHDLGMEGDTATAIAQVPPLTLYYHPVLQESFRQSIRGALFSALQLVESKQLLKSLYLSLNEEQPSGNLEDNIVQNQVTFNEIPVSRDGSRSVPNATQHNIPAWTIFAMFFIVVSLGSNVVREKQNGSFIRVKTLPTSYLVALFSKQLTYLMVAMAQVAVIFSIGIWFFPVIGLPRLNMPADLSGVLIVSLICGWCAVSYAICVGVFAQTQEQANGFGAVSIVILAALGGLLVPSFAMPDTFDIIMKLSPLHWCLEAYYGLFLEGGKLKDIVMNILPLAGIIAIIQLITLTGLKRKNLV